MFNWSVTLLMQTEKPAAEDILVEYHEISARLRKEIAMNTDFRIKFKPKNNEAAYSQILPVPIHLNKDLTNELNLTHIME